MSLVTYRKNGLHHRAVSSRVVRAASDLHLFAATVRVRKLFARAASPLWHALKVVAEVRRQRALIEVELYLRRYKHSSKNDDDLPIVRR